MRFVDRIQQIADRSELEPRECGEAVVGQPDFLGEHRRAVDQAHPRHLDHRRAGRNLQRGRHRGRRFDDLAAQDPALRYPALAVPALEAEETEQRAVEARAPHERAAPLEAFEHAVGDEQIDRLAHRADRDVIALRERLLGRDRFARPPVPGRDQRGQFVAQALVAGETVVGGVHGFSKFIYMFA